MKNKTESTLTVIDQTTSAIATQDKWASPEYIDPYAKRPLLQALRGEQDPKVFGYFVRESILAEVGWGGFGLDEIIEYEYLSGNSERGIMIQAPRMLVNPVTPLMLFDQVESEKSKQMIFAGAYDSDKRSSDPARYKPVTGYEIVLLDEANMALHETPMLYMAKGANGASFNEVWKQLIKAVTVCHAAANGIPAKPRINKFNALCVFAPTLKRELSGQQQKSYALKVDGCEMPTSDNWENYFVGRSNEELVQVIEQTCNFAIPRAIVSAIEDAELIAD